MSGPSDLTKPHDYIDLLNLLAGYRVLANDYQSGLSLKKERIAQEEMEEIE